MSGFAMHQSRIVLKLMADHDCYPLWRPIELGVENVDPVTLPISATLVRRLSAWSRAYDATVDQDDPRGSDFKSQAEAVAFVDEGSALRDELERELGSGFQVVYQREGEGLDPEAADAWAEASRDASSNS